MSMGANMDEIFSLIEDLESNSASAGSSAARFVVAVDWRRGACPLTLMTAFRSLVPPSAPMRLVFAVPEEPTAEDAECVRIIAESVDGDDEMTKLELESFATTLATGYDCAVVPNGDPEQLVMQVGGMITRMHYLMRRYEELRSRGADPRAVWANEGNRAELRRRFGEFPS